jgi:lipopolysaccharide exporter
MRDLFSILSQADSSVGLTERSLSALKWNYAGVVTRALAQFGVYIALARLLGPQPFGTYSVVLMLSGIGALVVERGLGSAMIQSRELTVDDIRYAFTRLLVGGVAAAATLCAVAPYIAVLFRYHGLTTAIYGSALYLFIYSISVVSTALLQRQLDMKSYQLAQVAAYLIGFGIVGIVGALLGFGPWSLIVALVTQWTIYMLIAYTRVRHSIRPLFRLQNKQLSAFGNLVLATNLLNYTIENADNLLIGRVFGMFALGLYSVSYNLVRTPTNHVVTTAQGVLFPAAARAQDNLPSLQTAYLTALSGVLLVLCPVFLSIAVVAHTVVQGLYGSKWVGAEALVAPLALAMPVHASITGSVLLWAKGRVSSELKVEAGTGVIFLAALLFASRVSIETVAWAVFAVYVVRAAWLNSKILDSIQLSWRAFWRAARGGVFLGMMTAAALFGIDIRLGSIELSALTRLVVLALMGLLIVTVLPMCIRSLTACAELRSFVEHATAKSPGLLRTVVQLYVKA